MKARRIQHAEHRIGWFVFGFFSISLALLWFFSDKVGLVLLYAPGEEIQDVFLYNRAIGVVTTILSVLIGLLAYIYYLHNELSQKPEEPISRETVSDLMLSREQFRKLYDNSPVPYFLMDDIGNIRNPNRATLRFFGGTVEECTIANFYSLVNEEGENAKQTTSMLRTKVERSIPISQEEMSIRPLKEKSEKYALVSIYSLEHTSSIPFKHLVTLVDVSKEKESERVKTDFLLLASHQLRTPLTTIKWYIDYLLTMDKTDIPAIVREYLEQIYIGNERMIELITTLLTVSRIEMGTLAPEYNTVHINELIDDVLEELEKDIQKRQTVIKVTTTGDDTLIMDKTMTRIIIHNLLTNAIKYTKEGGTVNVDSVFEAHACSIAVHDSGYGIPEGEQDKIFSKMFRASNARKVSTNGTGLGLYLCKAFAEKMGGEIRFKSKENEGSTFTILLPRVATDA